MGSYPSFARFFANDASEIGLAMKAYLIPQNSRLWGRKHHFSQVLRRTKLAWHNICSTTFEKDWKMTSNGRDGTVEFRFYRPQANAVQLAGDFSAWSANAVSMRNCGDGWWFLALKLNPGEYRFRYVADGQWFTDFAAHGIESCPNGWNSVLLVPTRQVAITLNRNDTKIKDTRAKVAA
jgi:1,4-alpha-glucan branching enzyme